MSCDKVLEEIDRIYSIVEEIERHIGRLAELSREQRELKGSIYAIYTLLVRLRDELVELRGAASEGCKCEG
jgi:hypothetical protein